MSVTNHYWMMLSGLHDSMSFSHTYASCFTLLKLRNVLDSFYKKDEFEVLTKLRTFCGETKQAGDAPAAASLAEAVYLKESKLVLWALAKLYGPL